MSTVLTIDRIASADGSAVMLHLRGELDIGSAATLRAEFAQLEAESVLVQMAELEFIDSSGLAALLDTKRRMDSLGRELRFRGARGEVRRVLERTGTLTFIES